MVGRETRLLDLGKRLAPTWFDRIIASTVER